MAAAKLKSKSEIGNPVEWIYGTKVTTGDGKAHGGFQWPDKPGIVTAPDWKPTNECGYGLHFWENGCGDFGASSVSIDGAERWYLVRADATKLVRLDGKVKAETVEVVKVGNRLEITDAMNEIKPGAIICLTATAGDSGTATAGDSGTATAGDSRHGDGRRLRHGDGRLLRHGDRRHTRHGDGRRLRGTATAGDSGTATAGYAGTATAGDSGTATAGYAGTATAGDLGTATAGTRGTATAGTRGTATAGTRGTATAGTRGTATAGTRGTATAGYAGTIVIKYYDGSRMRLKIGYVGEDGIAANTRYKLSDKFTFIPA
jgi:hypothetical protein